MGLGIVVFLGPVSELAIESFEAGKIQLAAKKLLAHTAEKAFDFPFGCAIPHGRVGEQTANAGADLDDFLGGINRTVINIQTVGDPAFVESGAEGLDEGIDVFGGKELAVAADARGVVDEGDEAGLDGGAFVLEARAIEGIGLPHLVGVGFGEGQALFVLGLGLGFEHVELLDDAGEGVGGHLGACEQPLLDAEAIKDGAFGRAVDFGQDGVNGLLDGFQGDLADLAFVGAGFVLHDRDAVLLVAGVQVWIVRQVNWRAWPSSSVKVVD